MFSLARAASDLAVPGWEEFVENLRTLPAHMLAKLPNEQTQDPQVRQEVGRLALEALASSVLDALSNDADHPAFMPQIGQVLNVGQPNADTVYRVARIHPYGVYRLRGRRGSLRMFNLSQSSPSPGEPGFKPQGDPGPCTISTLCSSIAKDASTWSSAKRGRPGMWGIGGSSSRPPQSCS